MGTQHNKMFKKLLPCSSSSLKSAVRVKQRLSCACYSTNIVVKPSTSYTSLKWPDSERSMRFHHVWLRDNCKCSVCKASSSGQRNVDVPLDDANKILLNQAKASDNTVQFEWKDGHTTSFDSTWLKANAYDIPQPAAKPPRKLWPKNPFQNEELPHVNYNDVINTKDDKVGLWPMLQHLQREGVCVVNGIPKESGHVGRVAERIAYLQETLYGRTFHVKVVPNPHNAAYAPVPLPIHMDLCYYESPPGFQFLHFIATECRGGANSFVDMFACAQQLREQHPDAFDTLCKVKFTFHFRDNDNWMYYRRSIFKLDHETGDLSRVYWSPPWQGTLKTDFENVEAAYDAYYKFAQIVNDTSMNYEIRFDAGQLIIFDNRRIGHSRREFVASDGMRWAEGTYVSTDEFENKFRVLKARFEKK